MLTPSSIFFGLKSSTLVSGLYGLMRHILYIICITPYCNITMSLVKHCVIKKDLYMAFHICMHCV